MKVYWWIKKEKFEKYNLVRVKYICKEFNYKYMKVHDGGLQKIYKGFITAKSVINGEASNYDYDVEKLPDIYIAELLNCRIVGGHSFIIKDRFVIDDILSMYRNVEFVRDDVMPCGVHEIYWIREMKPIQEIEEGICLVGLGAANYYHFTIEIISRIQYIDSRDEFRELPLLLDSDASKVGTLRELLNAVNVYKHPVIWIEHSTMYSVRKLIYPSMNVWMPFNIRSGMKICKEWYKLSEDSFRYIRGKAFELLDMHFEEPKEKIYISREGCSFQRLQNEEVIQKIFREYGYRVVCPEKLTWEEQVRLFHHARYIAGIGGAAFTNLIYCSKGATLITFSNNEEWMQLYPAIASMVGLKSVLIGMKYKKNREATSRYTFEGNIHELRDYLEYLQ